MATPLITAPRSFDPQRNPVLLNFKRNSGKWAEDTTNVDPLLIVTMQRFSEGDPIRVDIPDETDPDHERYHGVRGTVVKVLHDEAGQATGDERDSLLYRIEFEDGQKEDFRWRDLRPP